MSDIPGFEHPEMLIPEGSIPISMIGIGLYLSPNGEQHYTVQNKGDLTMLMAIGLLEAAKKEVLKWNDDAQDD